MTEANAGNGAENNAGAGDGAQNAEPKGKANSVSELPEWAQNELSRARNDAASYRTKLRETEAARDDLQKSLDAETAKTGTLQTELDDVKLSSAKFDVALEAYNVNGEQVKAFADRLRGSTSEELSADAKTMMETLNVQTSNNKQRAVDRTAGLGNDKPPTPDDAFADFVGNKLGWGK